MNKGGRGGTKQQIRKAEKNKGVQIKKDIHVEKRTVIFRSRFHCPPSSFALCPYANIALPKSGKSERRFGSISSSSVGFFIEESIAAITKKQKHKRSISSRQLLPYLLEEEQNLGLGLQLMKCPPILVSD